MLSDQSKEIKGSATMAINARVEDLIVQGRDIVRLNVGQTQFPVFGEINKGIIAALESGKTTYSKNIGIDELTSFIAARYGRKPSEVIISNGAKQVLFNVFQVIINPGDEVIVPRPSWVSYENQIIRAGGKPVFVDTASDWQLDLDSILNAVSRGKSKAIVINSPNNPTGAVYSRKTLVRLGELAKKHDIAIISDEAYDKFVYEGEYASMSDVEGIEDHLVLVNSFSKTYSMTGLRVGYGVAPAHVIKAMGNLQSDSTSGVCTPIQYGALECEKISAADMQRRVQQLKENRNYMMDELKEVFPIERPAGGLYLFADISRYLQDGLSSDDFAIHLLEKGGVAAMPGTAFGRRDHLRLAFCVDSHSLQKGVQRIRSYLSQYT